MLRGVGNPNPIGGPCRLPAATAGRAVGQAPDRSLVGQHSMGDVHHLDVESAAAIGLECDPESVRRPIRPPILGFRRCQRPLVTAFGVHHEEVIVAGSIRGEGNDPAPAAAERAHSCGRGVGQEWWGGKGRCRGRKIRRHGWQLECRRREIACATGEQEHNYRAPYQREAVMQGSLVQPTTVNALRTITSPSHARKGVKPASWYNLIGPW